MQRTADRSENKARSSALILTGRLSPGALALVATCLTAAACTDDRGSEVTHSAATAAPTAALKVAFLYAGAADDGGWNSSHEAARKALEGRYGRKLKTTVVEGKSDPAEVEAALRTLVDAGNTLVFATHPASAEAVEKIAAAAPTVRFAQIDARTTSKNLSAFSARTYEGSYMAGMVAGRMTKSNVLGIVGSMPSPRVILDINAFTLGAQSINPKITTKLGWINQWADPTKEAGEAQALLDQGADVLYQTTQSGAVVQTAEKAGKLALGWGSGMGRLGPHAHLGSTLLHWTPYYADAITRVLDGSWSSSTTWSGVRDGTVDFIPDVRNQVPPDITRKVDAIRSGLKDGTFTPWAGPITDQSGSILIAADTKPDDSQLRAMHSYVRGVESTQ